MQVWISHLTWLLISQGKGDCVLEYGDIPIDEVHAFAEFSKSAIKPGRYLVPTLLVYLPKNALLQGIFYYIGIFTHLSPLHRFILTLPYTLSLPIPTCHFTVNQDKLTSPLTMIKLGSSRGRGTRCAGWFDDHIQSQVQDSATKKMESIILLGGITGWANAGEQFVAMMDGYECEAWARKDK
jgi:hypothetical protein